MLLTWFWTAQILFSIATLPLHLEAKNVFISNEYVCLVNLVCCNIIPSNTEYLQCKYTCVQYRQLLLMQWSTFT